MFGENDSFLWLRRLLAQSSWPGLMSFSFACPSAVSVDVCTKLYWLLVCVQWYHRIMFIARWVSEYSPVSALAPHNICWESLRLFPSHPSVLSFSSELCLTKRWPCCVSGVRSFAYPALRSVLYLSILNKSLQKTHLPLLSYQGQHAENIKLSSVTFRRLFGYCSS